MGFCATRVRLLATVVAAAGLLGLSVGCQTQSKVTQRRLFEHRAMIDFSGLKSPEVVAKVNAQASPPRQWEVMPLASNPLYAHQQWKSPSGHTGVGVAHVRLPLPLGERMVMWLAKREYTKKENDGKVLAEWTDEIGRPWFEAQNDKYRVRGHVVVNGFSAWIIYFGHKTKFPPDPAELSLAARAAESIVPVFGPNSAASPAPAATDRPTAASTETGSKQSGARAE